MSETRFVTRRALQEGILTRVGEVLEDGRFVCNPPGSKWIEGYRSGEHFATLEEALADAEAMRANRFATGQDLVTRYAPGWTPKVVGS